MTIEVSSENIEKATMVYRESEVVAVLKLNNGITCMVSEMGMNITDKSEGREVGKGWEEIMSLVKEQDDKPSGLPPLDN